MAALVAEVEPGDECDQQPWAGLVLSDGSHLAQFGGRTVVDQGKPSWLQQLRFPHLAFVVS